MLKASEFQLRTADFIEKPDGVARPKSSQRLNGMAAKNKAWQPSDQKADKVHIEKQIEKTRSQKNHVIDASPNTRSFIQSFQGQVRRFEIDMGAIFGKCVKITMQARKSQGTFENNGFMSQQAWF
jgi:hypothetical protein